MTPALIFVHRYATATVDLVDRGDNERKTNASFAVRDPDLLDLTFSDMPGRIYVVPVALLRAAVALAAQSAEAPDAG